MTDLDLGEIYLTAHRRVTERCLSANAAELAMPVPTCPGWTVKAVMSHLCGIAEDIRNGVAEINTPPATRRQVEERSGWTVREIADAWAPAANAMAALLRSQPQIRALAIDAWTHDQDIHNALGVVSGRTGPGAELTKNAVWHLKRRLRTDALGSLRVVSGDDDWIIGDTDPAATLEVDPYELARAVLGRRSVAQMAAFTWTGPSADYIDRLPVFTPPPHDIVE